jgi:HD domain
VTDQTPKKLLVKQSSFSKYSVSETRVIISRSIGHRIGKAAMSHATILTDRFDRALLYATHVHGGHVRKETSTPYVAHLLAVAATVLEYGGDEDLAIAALLHDGTVTLIGNLQVK